MKTRKPFVPCERSDTVRQAIASLLRGEPMTAMDISEEAGIPVSEVYGHLEHLRHSLQREQASLVLLPASCRGCGFIFAKRQRLKRPGRCPICRGESISQPRYRISESGT